MIHLSHHTPLALSAVSPIRHNTKVRLDEACPKNWWNAANLSISSGSPSSLLLFIDLLGIKQRELGLWPTHLLSVTLLIALSLLCSSVPTALLQLTNVRPEVLNERSNDRMLKSHQRAVLPPIIKVIRNLLFCFKRLGWGRYVFSECLVSLQ